MSEIEGRRRPGILHGLSLIGCVVLLGLVAYGAFDVVECYRLGWLQRQAAHNVMLADAQRSLADSATILNAEDEITASNQKRRK